MFIFLPRGARTRIWLAVTALTSVSPWAFGATPADSTSAPVPEASLLDWRQVNETVGQFPRGHMDLIKLEPEPAPASAAPGSRALSLTQAHTLALARRLDVYERPGLSSEDRQNLRHAALALRWDTQRLWSQAVLAQQQARLSEEAAASAQTAAELGRRLTQTGSWTRAQWQQVQRVWLEADMARSLAQQQALEAREALAQLLGIDAPESIVLPDQLPPLPVPASSHPGDLYPLAVANRPALQQARLHTQRWIRAAGSGPLNAVREPLQQSAAQAVADGDPVPQFNPAALRWTPELERALEAERALYKDESALRSQLRQAVLQWRAATERTQLMEQQVALLTELRDDMQRRYNGMLKSTWDLLASSRDLTSGQQRLQWAQQQQWLAQQALQHLIDGGTPVAATASDAAPNSGSPTTTPGH